MAENTMSMDELRELSEDGFEVEFQKKTMVIEHFDHLIDCLKQVIAGNEERTRADLARSQTQLEVLATLQTLAKQKPDGGAKGTPIDLAPLQQVLAEIHKANNERTAIAYNFEIHRGEGGYMRGVTATPIEPTRH